MFVFQSATFRSPDISRPVRGGHFVIWQRLFSAKTTSEDHRRSARSDLSSRNFATDGKGFEIIIDNISRKAALHCTTFAYICRMQCAYNSNCTM
jgi:hypothetical protein